ncbi:hypothetical protein [Xanthomonas hydrangeae]|uniref:hypothetical protein n=1 Tax=Xanthomonas hydrangeae TaxID=2775159 RepID=UPI001963CA04
MNKKMRPSLGGLINAYSKIGLILLAVAALVFFEGPNQGSFAQRRDPAVGCHRPCRDGCHPVHAWLSYGQAA